VASRYIVYGLFCPRTGGLRYVGKSTWGLKRAHDHARPSVMRQDANTYKGKWVMSLVRGGLRPEVDILEESNSAEGLVEAEQFWIGYAKFLGCELTNLTIGGEGALGWRAGPDTLKKMSEAKKGRRYSIQHRERISAALRRHVRTPEHKRRVADAIRRRSADMEYRRKMAMLHGCRPFSDESGRVYQNLFEAASALGVDRSTVCAVLKGRRPHARRHVFRYVAEQPQSTGS